jgi:transcriptional regulator with XRE-family HTH domain
MEDSTALGRELGAELRELRKKAELNSREMANRLTWSQSKVSRMETGARRSASEVDVAVYLAHCRAPKEKLDELLETYRKQEDGYWIQPHTEQLPGELRSLIFQETTAGSINNYEPLVVPGLLQTEGYARALFHEVGCVPVDGIDLRVQARLDRQDILRRTWPPQYSCFIHEQALRLPVGGMQVMHEQMLHMLFVSNRSHCKIRVVPISAGAKHGASGPFELMEHDEHKPVIYVESAVVSLFLERHAEVAMYQAIAGKLDRVALNEGQSREFLASMASEYDRAEEHDARDRPGRMDLA